MEKGTGVILESHPDDMNPASVVNHASRPRRLVRDGEEEEEGKE